MRNALQNLAARLHRPGSKTTFFLSATVAVLLALNVYQYAAGASLRAQVKSSVPSSPVSAQVIPLANIEETNSPQFDAMITVLRDAGPSIERLLYYSDIYCSNAFFVPSDGSRLYHCYFCPDYDLTAPHRIMNENFAEAEGYSACPTCIGPGSFAFEAFFYDCCYPVSNLLDLIQYGSESDWMEAGAALTSPAA